MPMVDHMQAAAHAREAIYSVRKGTGFRSRAEAIQSKHGSRKAGLPQTESRPRKPKTKSQAEFDF
jgi:deoxyribodipyrimidine photo-lyase